MKRIIPRMSFESRMLLRLRHAFGNVQTLWVQHQWLRIALAMVLAGLSLVCGVATFLILTGKLTLSDSPENVLILLYIDLVLLLLITIFLSIRILRLWQQHLRQQSGSKLQTRLVWQFAAMALVPACLVTAFSLIFFDLGMETWFSKRVKTAITESQVVADAYLKEHINTIKADALGVARSIEIDAQRFSPTQNRLSNILIAQAQARDIAEAVIFQLSGSVIARYGLTFSLEFDRFPDHVLRRAGSGEIVVLPSPFDDRISAIVGLNNFLDGYLLITRFIDPSVLEHTERSADAVRQYHNLELSRLDIQISFTLVFIIFTIMLLFASIWMGVVFAQQIAVPISQLIAATKQVREGKIGTQVSTLPTQNDELSTLITDFNSMTNQLHIQRQQLIDISTQIDERRKFTEAVLLDVSTGVIRLDSDLKIALGNLRAEELLERKIDQLLGKHITNLEPQLAEIAQKTQSQLPGVLLEEQIDMKIHGRLRSFLVRATRHDTTNIGIIITFDDITKLQDAQRAAAWSDVARRIAHEVKNPLTPIQLSAERLRRLYRKTIAEDDTTFDRCIDTIIRQVNDIGRLIEEFSSFARMPEANLRAHDIAQICRQAVFLMSQDTGNDGIAIAYHGTQSGITIDCDNHLIGQMLTNLIKNAKEAIMQENNNPHMRNDHEISILLSQAQTSVTIEICDSGPGFPSAIVHTLTDPYITTKEKGSGLGLAIVKKIVADHLGQLQLQNDPQGNGAKVIVTLPNAHETNVRAGAQ